MSAVDAMPHAAAATHAARRHAVVGSAGTELGLVRPVLTAFDEPSALPRAGSELGDAAAVGARDITEEGIPEFGTREGERIHQPMLPRGPELARSADARAPASAPGRGSRTAPRTRRRSRWRWPPSARTSAPRRLRARR